MKVPETAPLWPLAVYLLLVVGLAGLMLGLSWLLGPRGKARGSAGPYESGIVPTGSARVRLSARFYLIAMFFVIFDLEAVFILAWAVAVRELKWTGYLSILVFIVLLGAALVYLWRLGALDMEPTRLRRDRFAGKEVA